MNEAPKRGRGRPKSIDQPKRIVLRLPESLKRDLHDYAQAHDTTAAAVVRDAVARVVYAKHGTGKTSLMALGKAAAPGKDVRRREEG